MRMIGQRVLLMLLFMSSLVCGKQNDVKPPNVIFILADDWGWGDLGCHGNEEIQTPNLDRMAEEGIRFDQFYVTAAVCSPSRASFLTGLYTDRHGIHSHLDSIESQKERNLPLCLDPKLPNLPRLLKQAGYATAHYGKWHLSTFDDEKAPSPSAYGFDHHKCTIGSGSGIHQAEYDTKGWSIWEGAREGPNWKDWRAKSSEYIIDETISFVEKNKDKPFYIQAWLYDTHAVLTPNEKQRKPFEDLPSTYQIYYSAVYDSDRHVGRLLDKLEELGLAENTIVIFSSDNGPEEISLWEAMEFGVGDQGPFRGRKRSGYEGGVRMPFIVHWPKAAPEGKVDKETIFSAVDLLPTICSLAGIENSALKNIDGQDMSAAIKGKPQERKEPIHWALQEDVLGPKINVSPKLIIREGRWKLMMNYDGSGVELYDISKNPLEVDNLADTNQDIAKRLKSKRMERYKQYGI